MEEEKDNLITYDQIYEEFGVPKSVLYRMKQQKKFPPTVERKMKYKKMWRNKIYYFDRDQVKEYLESFKA